MQENKLHPPNASGMVDLHIFAYFSKILSGIA